MSETAVRLYFMGFTEELVARTILGMIRDAAKANELSVADWALVRKDDEGKLKIENDQSVDPGAGRGALFGGGVGFLLALAGPVGMGAVVGAAAVGAVAAKLHDSGLKDKDLKAAAQLMEEGRTALVVAVPLDDVDRFDAFRAEHVEFEAPDRRHEVDITPDHSFQQALEEYRAAQAG